MMRWTRYAGYSVTDDSELIADRFSDSFERPTCFDGIGFEAARKAADIFAESDGGWRDIVGDEEDEEAGGGGDT